LWWFLDEGLQNVEEKSVGIPGKTSTKFGEKNENEDVHR
jgi:hypothetical protein